MLRGLTGHGVDLWRLLRFDPQNPHSLSKFRQLIAVAKRSGASTLIETGTYRGRTARRASRKFNRVITIEVVEELYRNAKASLADCKNIECLLGDCNQLLPGILDRDDVADCLVYLDGHFSDGVTGMGEVPEPAIEEIATIGKRKEKVRSVVVDDFRTFSGSDEMPSRSALFASIEKWLPEYRVTVHLDQVLIERC